MSAEINWSDSKSASLRDRYGIGFEEVLIALADGRLIDERAHPNSELYPHQRQLVVLLDDYVWVVPFVRDQRGIFLKTLFPSRKATKAFRERVDD